MPLRTRSSRATGPAAAVGALVGGVVARTRPEHLALARTGAGAVMLARPRVLPQALGVDSAASARVGWLVQMLGAREIALGLGTLAALRTGDRRAARAWVAAGLLSDAVDALVVGAGVARGRLSAVPGAAVAVTAAGASALAAGELRER